ncbi:MAG TPA: multicopper oxidase domain-containing protein [bacterium]|nr:multicopper oxidase domain-containing protein [bacterium]
MNFFKKFLTQAVWLAPPLAVLMVLALGFTGGWISKIISDRIKIGTVTAPPKVITDTDGDKLYASLDGPFLPRKEINAQDQDSNAILQGRAMQPKLLPDGTKEFDLTASAFTWQLYNTARVTVWGYNHQVPGPLIRLRVGDRVLFVVKNELPQATTIHWHGLAVPNAEDGVPGITQKSIPPGGQFTYHFTVTPQMIGTHLYHTHFNESFQMDQGLHGILFVEPARPRKQTYDVEAFYEMASFKVGGSDQENVFTLDGKAFPEAPVLYVPLGARVLLHLVNASSENDHVMHLHGYTFRIIALDGNSLENPILANTVNLGPSQTADVAFTANNPGKWMFHCHILDHVINPGPQGEGNETTPANMGGLMTYINVSSKEDVKTDYLAAGELYSDPTCQR